MIFLDDLRLTFGGQLFGEVAADRFTDFCYDWRLLQPGQLYVALRGSSGLDGHTYIAEAIDRGAAGVMCSQPPSSVDVSGTTVLIAPDVAEALGAWARHVLAKYNTTIIGIAGTTGTSQTKETVAAVLGRRYAVYKTPCTFEGPLGLALGLGGLSPDHQIAVLELSGGRAGRFEDALAVASPHVLVLTNTLIASVDAVGEPDRTAGELRQALAALPANGGLVLNYDDDTVRQLGLNATENTVAYGLDISGRGFGADLLAYNIRLLPDRVTFDLRRETERLSECWIPLLGHPQLYAALAALAVGVLFQMPLNEGLNALSNVRPLPGRLALLPGANQSLLIDDSFDASPVSLVAALDLLEALDNGQRRRILVLGDMHVPGDAADAEIAHRVVGGRVREVCDLVVTRGRMAAVAGRAAMRMGMSSQQARLVYSHSDASRIVRESLMPGDVVLVTGSRQALMERVSEQLLADPRADGVHLPRRTADWVDVVDTGTGVTSWVEVNLDAAANNVRQLKARVGPDVTLAAVVKANAYGHGAVEIASTATCNGADVLCVDNLAEAVVLREAGLDVPILILTYTPVWAAYDVIHHDLAVTLYDTEVAQGFNRVAAELDRTVRAHVKIDTGMGRLGLLPEEVPGFFRQLGKYDRLQVEGIFTHLSTADEADETYAREQLRRFNVVLDGLRAAGIKFRYVHAANSAATLALPESHFDMVRVGIALYGLSPSAAVPAPPELQPVLTWKTRVSSVKALPPGSLVGYGNTYQTAGSEQIAVLPLGYSDGFRRAPRNWGDVLVHGQRAPVVGRVSMGMTTINVTQIPNVRIGDEVVLIGRQGGDQITAEEVARRLDTINYEVVSAIPLHIPRLI